MVGGGEFTENAVGYCDGSQCGGRECCNERKNLFLFHQDNLLFFLVCKLVAINV